MTPMFQGDGKKTSARTRVRMNSTASRYPHREITQSPTREKIGRNSCPLGPMSSTQEPLISLIKVPSREAVSRRPAGVRVGAERRPGHSDRGQVPAGTVAPDDDD